MRVGAACLALPFPRDPMMHGYLTPWEHSHQKRRCERITSKQAGIEDVLGVPTVFFVLLGSERSRVGVRGAAVGGGLKGSRGALQWGGEGGG